MPEIQTCSQALLYPGDCCVKDCPHPATLAALDADMVEHARCSIHVARAVAVKSLVWNPIWGPRDAGE